MEWLKKEQEVKEKAEAHLYTTIKVARDEDLAEQVGRDIYFDLVDHDKVRSFCVQKQISFNLFKEAMAKEFCVPVQFQRYWLWAKRQNHTYRPYRPLTHIEEAQTVGQLRGVSKKVHNAELKLFLEVELVLDLRPIAPPDKTEDDILLFVKLYDPKKEELRYLGRLFVRSTGNPSEILMRLNIMAGYDLDEEIALYEEIKFEPNVMCEPIDKKLTFRASQLEDGDILCFQKAPAMDSEEHVRYPDVPSYLEYVHNRQLHMGTEKKQPAIPFQPSNSANPFVSPGLKYSSEKMREIIATAVMVHEHPFSIVEDEVWMWAFQYANSDFQKVTYQTVRGDCLAIYEVEKKKLKALLKSVSKISLTTDVWKSSHQVDEHMVIFGHFVDAEWKLQKRVLGFVKMSAPRYRIDVVDAIFKCLKTWEIENKVFVAVVDNASYNDSSLRNLKDNLSFSSKLFRGGALFHVRYYAHILILLVHDVLSKINDIIYNVRESVRYISYSDSRLKAFHDVVEQKHLKDRKLIIDCQTSWTSTFQMLSTALKFKVAFLAYMETEPQYDFAPTHEDWEKVDKVCQLLKEINLATHIISDSEFPTASLYLAEVWRVKQVIDNAAEDKDLFMREITSPMKVKLDKYLGECNLLIAIASVFDPRCKFHIVDICFPLIYESEEVAKDNIKKVRTSLQELYEEYASLSIEESSSGEVSNGGNNSPSSSAPKPSIITGFDQIMSLVREKKVVPTMKSELDIYLEEGVYIPDDDNGSFSALEWWRNNSLKFKILSKLAADVLAIPFSTVASEYPIGRVIDEFHSKLNEESIEALICGGDWLRHKYGLKRKVREQQEEIILNI